MVQLSYTLSSPYIATKREAVNHPFSNKNNVESKYEKVLHLCYKDGGRNTFKSQVFSKSQVRGPILTAKGDMQVERADSPGEKVPGRR